jgi:PAS domain S-box-containing protein
MSGQETPNLTNDINSKLNAEDSSLTETEKLKESAVKIAELEERLRLQESIYKSMLSQISDFSHTSDKEGRFIYVNQALLDLWGMTLEEVVGKNFYDLNYPPELAAKLHGDIQQVFDTGKRVTGRTPFVTRTGKLSYYDYTYSPLFAPDGTVEMMVAASSDITARQEQEKYRALFESMENGFCIMQMFFDENDKCVDYSFLQINPAFGKLTGIDPIEAKRGKTASELVPNLEAKWFEIYGNVALTGESIKIIEGSEAMGRWFEVYAFRAGAPEDRQVALLFTNITERKRAEQERDEINKKLEAERARLAYIFENAPAFVCVLRGAEHVFEITNPGYLQLIGHRNVIGKTVREGLPDIEGQGFYELLDKVYQTGEPFIGREITVELQHTPDSAPVKRILNFVYQPIYEADRTVSGIFTHGVDITEQVEARQTAENANRLKDEFLATLSHELRTPLNAILGWSQILKSQRLDEARIYSAIDTIDRSARAQKQLIEDILDVSRIITGKLRLDVRPVDLLKVISAAIEPIRPAAEAKNIRIQTLLDPKAANLSGDPDRLQQVVWNLLSNAVKFTPRNGRVQIRLERINSHVEIVVSDTGIGIDPEFLPHVFERFRQSDGSLTRRQGGLGLGLAIVRQIVELHGGTVSVESEGEDHGAAFTIYLPLLSVRAENKGEYSSVPPEAESDGENPEINADLQDLEILVVDDEADSRDLLKYVLNSKGAIVTTANSAAEALESVSRKKFDVIVSDVGMPEEDGFSLMRKIRNLPAEQNGRTPAIALTAYARAEDRIQAIQSGFQIHIAKPVNHAELIAVTANLAERLIS